MQENSKKQISENRWKRIVAIIVLLIVILVVVNFWQNRHLSIARYNVESNKTSNQLRIVQISDFHNDHKLGTMVIEKTRNEAPDIIAITGDLVDGTKTDVEYAVNIAKELTEIAPVYFVNGNHERGTAYNTLRDGLIKSGAYVLENESVELGENIRITGINDPTFDWDPDVDSVGNVAYTLSKISVDNTCFNILLSHRAEAHDAYVDYDLILTGHAHGGQFRIPIVGGIVAPDQGIFPKYDAGEYNCGKGVEIVSRGVGNSIIPIRINNPPELVVVDINR